MTESRLVKPGDTVHLVIRRYPEPEIVCEEVVVSETEMYSSGAFDTNIVEINDQGEPWLRPLLCDGPFDADGLKRRNIGSWHAPCTRNEMQDMASADARKIREAAAALRRWHSGEEIASALEKIAEDLAST